MELKYRGEILEIIKSIDIISEQAFLYQNRLFVSNPAALNSEEVVSIKNKINTHHRMDLANFIYLICHCRKSLSVFTKQPRTSKQADIISFINELSNTNTGIGTWEGGWKIVNIDVDNNIIVSKNGLMLWASSNQFLPDIGNVVIGTTGKVLFGKEYRFLLPGFYMALGNKSSIDPRVDTVTMRFYWNIDRNHAPFLVKLITTEFNNRNIPFKFKILNDPNNYPRADGAVLYIRRGYYSVSKSAILQIYLHIKEYLNPDVPLFAKALAAGLSIAEDPNNGESFGKHRSRILAESLHKGRFKNKSNAEEILQEVVNHFRLNKLSFWQPFLNFQSKDDYEMIPFETK